VGFEGKVKIWSTNEAEEGEWKLDGEIVGGYALWFSFILELCGWV
jgi:hypothetical protein